MWSMRSIKPDVGHLVRARHRSALDYDLGTLATGLVVNKRGIEVEILLSPGIFSWVRRDLVEVISETFGNNKNRRDR